MAKQIRCGMVGGALGAFIGDVHRKAANFDTRLELVAGCFSTRAEKNAETGDACCIAPDRLYADYKEMAAKESAREDGIDFVTIVTPNYNHYETAKAFLEAGINVICEKPLCFEVAQAEELEALAKENLSVWRKDPKYSGVSNCVGDIGTHIECFVHYVTGLKIKRLAATTNKYGHALDLNANMLIECEGGVNGAYWCSQIAAGHYNGLVVRVFGELGSLELTQEHPDFLNYTPKGGAARVLTRTGNETDYPGGGGARSAFWRQMLADALGCNIATSKLALEGPALGAAILAGVCAGVYDNVADAADSIVSIDGENSPEPAMSERLNKIYALGAGLLLLGAAGVLIGLMPQFMAVGSYALMLGFSLIAGVGYISIDLLMNSVIADVYKERKNGVLPYVHAFYGAGAMLAPVFVTALVSLERPESFARPYLILGLLSLTCAALMLLTGKRMKPQTPYADMEEIRGRARQNPAEIFREGSAWLFLLSGFMNLSFQTGLTTWLPRYCSLVWDYDLTAAGLMVTMYFMGALVMRLLSPFVYRKLGVKRYYQLTLLVSAALYGVSLASMVSPVVLGKLLTIDPQTAMLSITVCTVIAALALPKSKKA